MLLCCLPLIIILTAFLKPAIAYEQEIKSISYSLTEKIEKAEKKILAVADFTDLQGNVTELGRFLAEELSVVLAGAGKGFEVVDRTHLKTLLREHKLSMTGLIDPQTAKKLGQLAGVDALITGTITPFGDSVRLTTKILDLSTAKVISASSANIAKTQAIEELLTRGIEPAQPVIQESATKGSNPSTGNLQSKKIGDITVTIKKIVVSGRQVTVFLGFFNNSDKGFLLGRPSDNDNKPNLIDEKGNVVKYDAGFESVRSHNPVYHFEKYSHKYMNLTPKAERDLSMVFKYRDNYAKTGDIFSLSMKYMLYDMEARSASIYEVSFMEVKSQTAK